MAEYNNMYEKLSFPDVYSDDDVRSAIADGNLKPKQWSRDTIADGKIMQRDTMSQFFYRDMALASAADALSAAIDGEHNRWTCGEGIDSDKFNENTIALSSLKVDNITLSGDGVFSDLGVKRDNSVIYIASNNTSNVNNEINLLYGATGSVSENTVIDDGWLCVPAESTILSLDTTITANYKASNNKYFKHIIKLEIPGNTSPIASSCNYSPAEINENVLHFAFTFDNTKQVDMTTIDDKEYKRYKISYVPDDDIEDLNIASYFSIVNETNNYIMGHDSEPIIPTCEMKVKAAANDSTGGFLDTKITTSMGLSGAIKDNAYNVSIDTSEAEHAKFLCYSSGNATDTDPHLEWRHPVEYIVADLDEKLISSDNSITHTISADEHGETFMNLRTHLEFIEPATTYDVILTNDRMSFNNNDTSNAVIMPIKLGRGKLDSISFISKGVANANTVKAFFGFYGSNINDLSTAKAYITIQNAAMQKIQMHHQNKDLVYYNLELSAYNETDKTIVSAEKYQDGYPKIVQTRENSDGTVEKNFYNWIVFGMHTNNQEVDMLSHTGQNLSDFAAFAVGGILDNKIETNTKFSAFNTLGDFVGSNLNQNGKVPFIQFNLTEL